MMRWSILLVCLLAAALPAHAQQRMLDVPASARWQHARSGVVLPTVIDGLPRRGIIENTPDELDMMAHYEDGDTRISLFLYRPSLFDVGIWFDRAETVLRANAMFGAVTPAAPAPILFAPPGATVASAMRQSYAASGDYRATALAIVPTGRWLVKIRVSSRTGTAEQVDARVSAAIAALRFDAAAHRGPPARAVQPCAVAVRWRGDARMLLKRGDGHHGNRARGAPDVRRSPQIVADDSAGRPSAATPFVPPTPDRELCRDATSDPRFAVYRRASDGESYLMAVGDAGGIATSGRIPLIDGVGGARGGRGNFSVIYSTGNEVQFFALFDRLLSPAQAFELIDRFVPNSTVVSDPDLISAG